MYRSLIKSTLIAGAFMAVASPAFAQTVPEHGIFILNSLLFLIGGFLVMFMACGFCMLEAGLVRAKKYHHPINQKYCPVFHCCYRLLPGWV
jgi:Amt family ammonium transporter